MNKEKIIELLTEYFRPKYYNKITWTVVLAGLSLIGTSFFELILNEILKENFKINIISEQDGVYGLVLVFLGLAYHLTFHFIDLKKEELGTVTKKEEVDKNINHDSRIFDESNKILNEDELDRILNHLYGGHETHWDEIKKVWAYIDYFKLKSNKFLIKEIATKNDACFNALKKLSEFVALNFFATKYDAKILQMLPELNWDRTSKGVTPEGEAKYDEMTSILNENIQTVDKTFGEYRDEVKRILKV